MLRDKLYRQGHQLEVVVGDCSRFPAMSEYNENLPKACPPLNGIPLDVDVYRAVRAGGPSYYDFESHAERNDPRIDKNECESWGLSVWLSLEHVEHARRMTPFFRKCRIAKIHVHHDHGVLCQTGVRKSHYTLWKKTSVDYLKNCVIALEPANR